MKRYTPREDKLIRETIKKHPENLQKCFRTLATQLNRSPEAIGFRWYAVLSKESTPCFMLQSSHKTLKNRKVYTPTCTVAPVFNRIKYWWRKIAKLS